MSENKLRTAVLGLSGRGELLLEAAAGLDYFQIEAVADKDSDLAAKVAEQYGCTPFDDYRQLIMQNQLDCLLVAAGMHSCDEHIRTAIKKKCNILKLTPPARDFEEAVEFVQLAEDEDVRFAVANMNRFSRSFLALQEYLQQGRIERIFLITATCAVGDEHPSAWQSDPKRAGGGVLLHGCYELVDQIVSNFGIPEQAYSLNTNIAGDRQQRLSVTEDTALVALKFSDTLIGNVIASRRIGVEPGREFLQVYGKDKIVSVSESRFSVADCVGLMSDELEYEDDELYLMGKVLENFALSLLRPDENKLSSDGRENLKVMAVIESAYLSARTGMAEEPGRILQMASRGAGESIST
jgi:predicted dehydrogenase